MKISFKNSVLIAGVVAGLSFGAGCKKALDINQSPNLPAAEQGTPKLVFPAAVMGTTARVGGDLAILGVIWGQYSTQSALSSQYRQLDAYNVDGSQINGPYTGMFSSGLKNFQFIIDKSKELEDWNFLLMGTVMKAYTYGLLVDLYDKVPYTEAFGGASNLNPVFDEGKAIYTALLKELDDALAKDFTASTVTSPGKFDLIFPPTSGTTDVEKEISWTANNNIDKWKQFANTLKLKFFLRMVNKDAAAAQAGIQKLYTDNAEFLTVDAGVTGFTNEPGKDNPMYEQNIRQLNTPDNIRASVTLVSFLQAKADPRINYYFGTASPGAIHQGDYLSTDPSYGSATRLVQRATDPVVFLSAAESLLMQAEARERYFAGAGAKALYDAGVQASFTAMSAGSAATLLAGAYAYPATTLDAKIEAISTQKWISYGHGLHYIEGFFEKQRTGFPRTSPVYSTAGSYVPGQWVVAKNSVLPAGLMPRRLVFPDVEKNRNSNTPAIVPIQTGVWWAL
jgi:hypothetical protein